MAFWALIVTVHSVAMIITISASVAAVRNMRAMRASRTRIDEIECQMRQASVKLLEATYLIEDDQVPDGRPVP